MKDDIKVVKYEPYLQSNEEWLAQRVAAVALHISLLSADLVGNQEEIGKFVNELNGLVAGVSV